MNLPVPITDAASLRPSESLIKVMRAKAALELKRLGDPQMDDPERAEYRGVLLDELERFNAALRARSAQRIIGGSAPR